MTYRFIYIPEDFLMFVYWMNFLAHFHFFRHHDDHYHLGLIFPDLLNHFCKHHYPRHIKINDLAFEAIHKGCLTHLNADKIFHQSKHFKHLLESFSATLNPQAQWPRKWFFNHVLAEIMIDRILLIKHPQSADEFYASLRQIEADHLNAFLTFLSVDVDQFMHGFKRFIAAEFVKHYDQDLALITSIQNLYRRVGINYTFTPTDQLYIQSSLVTLQSIVEEKLPAIVNELSQINDICV